LRQKDPTGLTALEIARQRTPSEFAVFLTQQESESR
jgi:hypothetical protein